MRAYVLNMVAKAETLPIGRQAILLSSAWRSAVRVRRSSADES